MPKRPVKLSPTPAKHKWILMGSISVGILVVAAGWYNTVRQIYSLDFSNVEGAVEQAADTVYEEYQEKRTIVEEEQKSFQESVEEVREGLREQQELEQNNEELEQQED
jgi:hypothetical protein